MKELVLSDSGSEHSVTLTVVLKYHGEKIMDIGAVEQAIVDSIAKYNNMCVNCDDPMLGEDSYLMEASVRVVSQITNEGAFCANKGQCDDIPCTIRGF